MMNLQITIYSKLIRYDSSTRIRQIKNVISNEYMNNE
jgi:hypothetical protein